MRITSTANYRPIQRTAPIAPLGYKIRGSKADKDKAEGRFDSSAINPFASKRGGVSNLIDAIMEKRKAIIESKNQLVSTTLENGDNMKTIQAQLDVYDEMLTALDEQIAEVMAAESERLAETIGAAAKEKDREKEPQKSITNPMGDDGMAGLSARISDISFLSGDIQSLERLASTKERFDSRIEVLKSDIKMDSGYSGTSALSKQDLLSRLQNSSNTMARNLATGYGDVQAAAESLANNGAEPTEAPAKSEESPKPEGEETTTQKTASTATEKYLAAMKTTASEEKEENSLDKAV